MTRPYRAPCFPLPSVVRHLQTWKSCFRGHKINVFSCTVIRFYISRNPLCADHLWYRTAHRKAQTRPISCRDADSVVKFQNFIKYFRTRLGIILTCHTFFNVSSEIFHRASLGAEPNTWPSAALVKACSKRPATKLNWFCVVCARDANVIPRRRTQ